MATQALPLRQTLRLRPQLSWAGWAVWLMLVAVTLYLIREQSRPQRGADAPIATLTEADGRVESRPDIGATWEDSVLGGALYSGDHIMTRAGASARLRFTTGEELELSENAHVIVVRPGGDGQTATPVVTLLTGRVTATVAAPAAAGLRVEAGSKSFALPKAAAGKVALEKKRGKPEAIVLAKSANVVAGPKLVVSPVVPAPASAVTPKTAVAVAPVPPPPAAPPAAPPAVPPPPVVELVERGARVLYVGSALPDPTDGALPLPLRLRVAGTGFDPRSAVLQVVGEGAAPRQVPIGEYYDPASAATPTYRVPLGSLLAAGGGKAAVSLAGAPAGEAMTIAVERAASLGAARVTLAWSGKAASGPGPCTEGPAAVAGGRRLELASAADAEAVWWLTAHAQACAFGPRPGDAPFAAGRAVFAVRQGAIVARLDGGELKPQESARLAKSLRAGLVFSGEAGAFASMDEIKSDVDAWRQSLPAHGRIYVLVKGGADASRLVELNTALIKAYDFAAAMVLAEGRAIFTRPVHVLAAGGTP